MLVAASYDNTALPSSESAVTGVKDSWLGSISNSGGTEMLIRLSVKTRFVVTKLKV